MKEPSVRKRLCNIPCDVCDSIEVTCDANCKHKMDNGKCGKKDGILIRDKGFGPHCRAYEEVW